MTDPAHPHRSSEDDPPDDRPSIAELQRVVASGGVINAMASVLLEIAATGLAWAAAEDAMDHAARGAPRAWAAVEATRAFNAHRAALAKVKL